MYRNRTRPMVGLAVFALLAVACQGPGGPAPTRQLLGVTSDAVPATEVSAESATTMAMACPVLNAANLTLAQKQLIKNLIIRHRVETLAVKMKPLTQELSRILGEEKLDIQALRDCLAQCQAIHNAVMIDHVPLLGALRSILSAPQQLAVAKALLTGLDTPLDKVEVPATGLAKPLPVAGERLILTPAQKVLFGNLKDMSVLTGTLRRAIATFMVNGDEEALKTAILTDPERQTRLDAIAAALGSLTAAQRQILLGSRVEGLAPTETGTETTTGDVAVPEPDASPASAAYQLFRHGGGGRGGARMGGGHGGHGGHRGHGGRGGHMGHGGHRGHGGYHGHHRGHHHRGHGRWGGYWGSGYWYGGAVNPFWWGSLPYVPNRYLFLGGMYYPFYTYEGLYYPDLSSPYQIIGGQYLPAYQMTGAPANVPTSVAPAQAVVVAAEQ